MSATETEFTNTTMLGLDPLEPDGIGEEAMLTVVLPYIHNAREGVQRLGELLTKYGTCESNGIAFSDADEVWYLKRLAVITGRLSGFLMIVMYWRRIKRGFQEIDFDAPDDFQYSADLKAFAEKYHLNKAKKGFNFRDIFGEDTQADHFYNTPRVWYARRC